VAVLSRKPAISPKHRRIAGGAWGCCSSPKLLEKSEIFRLSEILGCRSEIFITYLYKNALFIIECVRTHCQEIQKFVQLILRKITKIVATRCHILRLKCTKFDFGWGSAPDPLAGFKGSYL